MRVPPIPRSLLPDSMIVRPAVDSDHGRSLGDPCAIEHVRYVRSEQLSGRRHVLREGSRGVVFIDRANSTGAFEVPAYSEVSILGERLTAVKCTPCEEFGGSVHHWELEVA